MKNDFSTVLRRNIKLESASDVLRCVLFIFLFHNYFGTRAQDCPNHQMNSVDCIVELLDARVYEVPGFGYLRFQFNKRDSATRNAELDEKVVECTDRDRIAAFDVNVRYISEKRYEPINFKLEIDYPASGNYVLSNPNEIYYHGFLLNSLDNFPCTYIILGNGELYVKLKKYEKLTFEQAKQLIVGGSDKNSTSIMGGDFSFPADANHEYWVNCVRVVED